ncbi:aldose epimerase [Paenibacillus psychroresistens]|uniref:Aldose epimerase n=1 Tax=Paenibacillus psychroresistens TaxID=1778678 RepID=A0A6B8RD23_9BACL|nr:aldose epimerase [Paenibacillus psychroresistens]QGQ94060.1 aldose epimerase [Paenibacillus psychroresistens]
MYEISINEGPFPIYEVKDIATNSWFHISPERGGIVTSYGVNGEEQLYLDKPTFDDPKANIRGGIPILFPICGQLVNKAYEWDGQTYIMDNHGVARTNPWEVVATEQQSDYASITIKQASTPETLKAYPFAYELVFTFRLQAQKLHIEQEYRNHSIADMPMYAGFHPYFLVDNKENTVESDASQLIYLTEHKQVPYTGEVEMSKLPDSIAFAKAATQKISFQPKPGHEVHLTYGDEFQYVVIWSLDGKPFMCVEPWMALTNEFNVKQELVYVKPNEPLITFMTIGVN